VGQLPAAGQLHRALLEQGMRRPAVLGYLGLCRYAEARYAEALALLDEAASEVPGAWFAAQATLCRLHLEGAGGAGKRGRAAHGLAAALAGDTATALRQAGALERALRPYGHFHHAEYDIACIHALLGDAEQALRWLRAAAKDGFPCRPQFESDPWLAGLRGQPEFESLLAELAPQSAQLGALAAELGLAPKED
jgi:tetratricopeptide (TPR) repeat protein